MCMIGDRIMKGIANEVIWFRTLDEYYLKSISPEHKTPCLLTWSPLSLFHSPLRTLLYPKQVQSPPSWHYRPVVASSSAHVYTPPPVRHIAPALPRTNYGPNPYHISTPRPVDGHVNPHVSQVQSYDRRVCARPWHGRRWF
jgi:hypothetical protein